MNKITPKTRVKYEIDAKDQTLGRLATKIAGLLMGKNSASYERHQDNGGSVIITNASKIKLTGKKLEQKEYYHYSGYPGGLKTKAVKEVFQKDPAEVLKRAVWNMLPKNKLRNDMIKRLKITN